MRNYSYNNELNRAVSLLNFEQENWGEAKELLSSKYNIPKYYLTLIVQKIFIRLGKEERLDYGTPQYSIWDQFHQVASEEVKSLQLVS